MVKAARPDTLIERVDQLADVYGEVLLGLYDELTDQRERTEAVAARADAVLTEARRLMDDMGAVAAQVRILEQQTTEAAASIPAPTGLEPGARAVDPEVEARTNEALARLTELESTAAALEASVQERMDAAVARCETITADMSADVRAQVEQSVADVHTEVQGTIAELRQHVRDLVDAVTLEAQEASQRAQRAEASAAEATEAAQRATAAAEAAAEAAPAPVPAASALPDTADLVEDLRRQASETIAEEVRRHAAERVAEELERQRPIAPPAPVPVPSGDGEVDAHATERLIEQLRAEMEARTSHLAAGAQRAEELSLRLDQLVSDAQSQLHDAKTDRAAAAFALRESRAELDAAKRALEASEYAGAVDRLRRTEMFLYATAMIAVVAIALALWALLK